MVFEQSKRSLVCVFVATTFLVLPPSAVAQQFGVKAGVNSASLTPEEDEDPDLSRRIGPAGGVWVQLPASPAFSFQAEGLFSEKGVKFDPPAELGVESVDIRLRYFEIPLLARGDFGASGSAARLFVVGGVAPAFKMSARTEFVAQGQEESRDAGDDFYSWDLGLVGGVGVELGRALIEARYTHGVRHINTDDNGDEDRIKNRVFSVMFGFRFR